MTSSTMFWNQICQTLKQRVGETAFEAWLKPIRPRIDEPCHQLILEVPNDFFKEWVVQHYDLIIRELLKNLKSDLSLSYEVNPTLDRELKNTKIADRKPLTKEKIAEGAFLNPKYTFENFVVGPSNRFTNAACLSIAESPAKAYNPLFIYGKVGLGKTHLMQAICHHILERNPKSKFYFYPVGEVHERIDQRDPA